MNWTIKYLPEVEKDLKHLGANQKELVLKAIKKVQTNPLPVHDGGYGKPLGNKDGYNLTNLLKIKIRDAGIRIVYKLIKTDSEMLIVVVGARADEVVYDIAYKRRIKYDF